METGVFPWQSDFLYDHAVNLAHSLRLYHGFSEPGAVSFASLDSTYVLSGQGLPEPCVFEGSSRILTKSAGGVYYLVAGGKYLVDDLSHSPSALSGNGCGIEIVSL